MLSRERELNVNGKIDLNVRECPMSTLNFAKIALIERSTSLNILYINLLLLIFFNKHFEFVMINVLTNILFFFLLFDFIFGFQVRSLPKFFKIFYNTITII